MAVATAIFRSRERSEHYELRLSLDHLSALTKKGEIKMKSMNLFGGNDKSSETFFTSKKESKELTGLPPVPIQDENGNLTFKLEGKTYSLNVNSEEEREKVKTEVNANSLAQYDWFKETTGEKHWVFYNTEMYEYIKIIDEYVADKDHLQYREHSALTPV